MPRQDNLVSPSDHTRCENAIKAAKITKLKPKQAKAFYTYQDNLIKFAKTNDKEIIVELIKVKIGLDDIDTAILAFELIDNFAKCSRPRMFFFLCVFFVLSCLFRQKTNTSCLSLYVEFYLWLK